MEIDAIHKYLHSRFGSAVGAVEQTAHCKWIEIDPDAIDAVCELLKEDPKLRFDSLSNLSGIDYPDQEKIQVVYDLYSYEHGHEITLKVDTDRDSPRINTVEGVWRAANWLEREVYDLLGVDFAGHSDLRRILLPEDWEGHPLRKDYVEPAEYHGISTSRESMLDIPDRR